MTVTLGTEAAGKTGADRAETPPTEDVDVSQRSESATNKRPFGLCWDEGEMDTENRHSNDYLLQ